MEAQRAYFNSMADTWDKRCSHDMKKIDYLLDLLEMNVGEAVLDVGSGTGVLIGGLYKRVGTMGRIKAVDLSERMIEVAQGKYNQENIIFHCGDVLDMEEEKGAYDHIVCYSMFPHFQSRKEEAIKKLAEKLKEGGKLMICHSQSRKAINQLHRGIDGVVQADRLPTMDRMVQYFSNANLKVLKKIDNKDMFVIIGIK